MRILCVLACVAAGAPAALSAQSPPLPDETRSPPPAVAEAGHDLEEKAWAFLEAFIDGENTPAEQLEFFADRVHYYDQGEVGKNVIGKDIRYTMRRWPWRRNTLVEIEYLKPLPEQNKVFVSYVVDFEVSNARRVVHGTARYGAVIVDLDVEPRIEGIFEKVAVRKRISPLD